MRFGVQLFGVLNGNQKKEEEIFRLLRETGVGFVEPCITTGRIEGFENVIWTTEHFEELMPLLKENGLTAVSCHIFSRDLSADIERLRYLADVCGIRQFVVKSPQDLSERSLQETALNYIQTAQKLAGSGAELLVHNEAADIRTRIGGRTAYEYLLDLCLGRVGAQIDAGWALYAGEDPEALLWRNKERVKSVHYKDFSVPGDPDSETAVGEGKLDLSACFQFARAFGLPQICDQDSAADDIFHDIHAFVNRMGELGQTREHSVSYLNVLDTETGKVKTLHRFEGVIEAPNWLKGENAFLYNAEGHIWRYDPEEDSAVMLDSGACDNCNNDHVVSPDETLLAVSHGTAGEDFNSWIYLLPIGGGEPRRVTPNGPSFLHGWSPDGKELAYCAFRMQETGLEVDVYAIPAEGGEERRLTDGGFNDGPEYSPDGKYIWFNSTRSGLMQIWRMERDGSSCVQMTDNGRNNWFAHVSPDGEKVVYLSYRKGDLDPHEHLPNMEVEIWRMDADGGNQTRLVTFFGGQGSMNVNSWAKDSRQIAFVSYELKHGE